MSRLEFYDPESNRSFSADRCFLCGISVGETESEEHVFPKWMQKEFNLWNQRLFLLNKTSIPYKSLTIPCCHTCNTKYLSTIETKVAKAYRGGYKEFRNIDECTLFIWLSKIFYGLLFKELLLPYNRAEQNNDEKIIPVEIFEQFRMAHYFLQAARIPLTFKSFVPWSIFIFESQVSKDCKLNFDYHDSFFDLTFGIRMGEISIVACLQDNGTQAIVMNEYIKELQSLRLHPCQFTEIFAKTTYAQRLLNRVPKYITVDSSNGLDVISPPLQGLSTKPVYDEWSHEEYAKCLSTITQLPIEQIFVPPHLVRSCLHNEDNSLKKIIEDTRFR